MMRATLHLDGAMMRATLSRAETIFGQNGLD